jgi:cytochrome c-type biogenesis protein CcmH
MITFALLAFALIAVTLFFVLLPLLRRQGKPANASSEVSIDRVNINIYRDQMRELDTDLAAGTIDRDRHAEAHRELERRLLEDTDTNTDTAPAPHSGKMTAIILAAVIPLAAIGLYWIVGTPAGLAPDQVAADTGHGITPEQVEGMIEKLAARLKEAPDDGEGWVMLGRSYAALQRFGEAAAAYAQAVTRIPDNAQVLVDYADVLAMSRGRSLEGEPEKLVQRALVIDPGNVKALALAGTIAFDKKEYAAAATHWQKLVNLLPADSEMAIAVKSSITEAQSLAGGAGRNAVLAETPAKTPQKAAPASAQIGGSVQIAGALKARAAPNDTVFIFAKAVNGPPAPLAILRMRVADLPAKFTLDDTMAMAPGMNLSRFGNVIIGARISKSGTANRQAGDLEGYSKNVIIGATDVAVVIDTEVR